VPTASYSDQRRALMLPREITGLGKGRELVIMEDVPPILARKVRYFDDRVFTDRLKKRPRWLQRSVQPRCERVRASVLPLRQISRTSQSWLGKLRD
jgi:type IV secretory pathway TraG/TraD family ATPase VirD4